MAEEASPPESPHPYARGVRPHRVPGRTCMLATSRDGSCCPKNGTQSRACARFHRISHGRPVGCTLAQTLLPSYSWPTWGRSAHT